MTTDRHDAVPEELPFTHTPPPTSTDPYLTYIHQTQTRQFNLLQQQMDQLKAPAEPVSDDRIKQLISRGTMWRQALVLLGFLVTGAVGTVVAIRGYATDFVEETAKAAHQRGDEPIKPSVSDVDELKKGLGKTKSGVRAIVQGQQHQDEIRDLELDLKPHQQQYEDRVAEWAAKKARMGPRAGEKPGKSPEHIRLENELRRRTKTGGVDYTSVIKDLDTN